MTDRIEYAIETGDVELIASTYKGKVIYACADYDDSYYDPDGDPPPDPKEWPEQDASPFWSYYHDKYYRTNRLPLRDKNEHRAHWGLPPLTEEKPLARWYTNWGITLRPNDGDYTAPLELQQKLEEFGATKIQRMHLFGNPSVGLCYTFALNSARYKELKEKFEEWGYGYLEIKLLNWCDHGWGS